MVCLPKYLPFVAFLWTACSLLDTTLFPYSPYVPSSPLLNNQHVQTIGGHFLRDPDLSFKADFEEFRLRIPTPDGDFFDVDVLRRRIATSNPPKIAVILHGLESTSTSPLCQSLSSNFVKQVRRAFIILTLVVVCS